MRFRQGGGLRQWERVSLLLLCEFVVVLWPRGAVALLWVVWRSGSFYCATPVAGWLSLARKRN